MTTPSFNDFEPNLFLTAECNQNCIFCSAKGENRVMTEKELSDCLKLGYQSLTIEGGEPLMSKDLIYWIGRARKSGAHEITLFTNGLLLTDRSLKALIKKGVSKFNFNLPSHIVKLHDILTGSKNQFPKRILMIKRTSKSLNNGVIITFVLNTLNYKTLPAYIGFIAEEFPKAFYIALNFIKIKGLVKKRKYLVPKLSEARPYIVQALTKAKKLHMPIILDGFPLCIINGYEEYSRDVDRIIRGDKIYLGEKKHIKECLNCGLKDICAGPRKDYLKLFGEKEISASLKKSSAIINKVKKGQLRLNVSSHFA
ncbi:MAG: radical SAM protein [Elusimicrobia bacterium]|nr:radical SAM protein [Elusimicrobiota bacterium]